jgi:hypothetical protein
MRAAGDLATTARFAIGREELREPLGRAVHRLEDVVLLHSAAERESAPELGLL